jgi:hypothetical protein
VTDRARHPPTIQCRYISASWIAAGLTRRSIRWRSRSLATRPPPRSRPCTSKFDAVLAGKAQFTPQEQAGYDLFRGKAQCNACHRDGGPGEDPLFTDFTASNIGTPANPRLPFYSEDHPDARGYVANSAGSSFVDGGVGAFDCPALLAGLFLDKLALAISARRRSVHTLRDNWPAQTSAFSFSAARGAVQPSKSLDNYRIAVSILKYCSLANIPIYC